MIITTTGMIRIRYKQKRQITEVDRRTGHIGGGGQGCCGHSDGKIDEGDNNYGRGMGRYSCQYIVESVAALGFLPVDA